MYCGGGNLFWHGCNEFHFYGPYRFQPIDYEGSFWVMQGQWAGTRLLSMSVHFYVLESNQLVTKNGHLITPDVYSIKQMPESNNQKMNDKHQSQGKNGLLTAHIY